MTLVALRVVLYQGFGASDGRAQVLGVAGHLVEFQIAVAVFANHMRLNVVFAQIAPAAVARRSRIRRCVGNLGPRVALGREPMFQLIIDKRAQESERALVPGVGIEALDKAFHHGAKIAG